MSPRTRRFLLLFLLFITFSNASKKDLPSDTILTKIAFGSCNQYDEDQSIWKSIVDYDPQLWIWLGDVSYNDDKEYGFIDVPATVESMKDRYAKVKASPLYQKLRNSTMITGIWDDHDYGKNDGGASFELKEESKKEFLHFMDENEDSQRYQRDGIYQSFTFGDIKIILLDTRFFKTPQESALTQSADILGEKQWIWLENQLKNSPYKVHLIGSSIQILPNEKPIREKWANYPKSRKRLLDLLNKTGPSGVVFLTGDIHYGEFNRQSCSALGYPLYELTSSGLTHSCAEELPGICHLFLNTIWKSHYNWNGSYAYTNFGTIEIERRSDEIVIHAAIRSSDGKIQISTEFKAETFRPEECPNEQVIADWRLQSKGLLAKKFVFAVVPFVTSIIVIIFGIYLFVRK
eukprot:TRINITY_DN9359_c0_g1_i1.p1 TRINITY_DN9359_c0_g1~~TRINITY_DN9359_c0_g1_i1.p1  ORF type:complete len:404 (+),score=84.71 TRINITY_DN9359_c0_g1_i1:1-1212(+)